MIERKAGLAGMSTSVYVRQAALGAKLSARVNDRVYAALGRIGGNLNQLARIANRTRCLPLERYLRDAVEEVLEMRRRL